MASTMSDRVRQRCQQCGSTIGFTRSDDGFFYCDYCCSQADDIVDTGLDEENLFNIYSASQSRARPTHVIAAEPISQVNPTQSQYVDHPDHLMRDTDANPGDGVGPTEPSDFGSSRKNLSYSDYYSEIRSRYAMGLQIMIQLQCKALVEEFNVSPLIIGLIGPIWLRFLASTRIMSDEWADQVVQDSETQAQGEAEEFQPSSQYGVEPVNLRGQRLVMIWYRSLSNTIPLSYSLAISFLVCHVSREAIIPCDVLKSAIEGKLPYFAAFTEIEKQLGPRSDACPISVSRMFRPTRALSSQKLESIAASIARKIGLELPPVNFYAIASRYCRQLSLPLKDIIPTACRIYEWAMPSELYISTNEFRIPTRATVMSILIVAIRVLFDINGYGVWESSLSNPSCSLSSVEKNAVESNTNPKADTNSVLNDPEPHCVESDAVNSRWNVVDVLKTLESKYHELHDAPAYSSDFPSYLQYCKDVVFAGLQPSYEDPEEERLIEEFWEFYQNSKSAGSSKDQAAKFPASGGLNACGSDHVDHAGSKEVKNRGEKSSIRTSSNSSTCKHGNQHARGSTDEDDSININRGSPNQASTESCKDSAIMRLKLDMEENKFCYVSPRVKIKNRDYIHYVRKRKDVLIYAVHADYYILLRSCAKAAQVETRIMHIAVLGFERRLQWLEKRIDSILQVNFSLDDECDFCADENLQSAGDGSKEKAYLM